MRLIADVMPDLVNEAVSSEDLEGVSVGSAKKIEWHCKKGHHWKAPVYSRAAGKGCPICANRRIVVGYNDLMTTHPEFAQMLKTESDAYTVHAGSVKKVLWLCEKGHEWSASVRNVVQFGHGCLVCAGKQVLKGYNDLATVAPDLTKELVSPDDGYLYTAHSNKKVLWQCNKYDYHKYEMSPNERIRGGSCPYCGLYKAYSMTDALKLAAKKPGMLLHDAPELADELVDLSLKWSLRSQSGQRVLWKCRHGHEWFATVSQRFLYESGCPYCAGKQAVVGENDLSVTHPDLFEELVDKSVPIRYGSHDKVLWKCKKGHVWSAMVFNRAIHGSGCPFCTSNGTSKWEQELYEILCSWFGEDQVVFHDQTVLDGNRELDIYIPSKKIAVELNGCYWHTEDHGCDRRYHQKKYEDALKKGVQCIQIFDDDWKLHREAVLRMIASKCGVLCDIFSVKKYGARQLKAGIVAVSDARTFLDRYHIQGFSPANVHLGLFTKENELVAVMSLRNASMGRRLSRSEGEWDIQRYATSAVIAGGFSKLMKFGRNYLLDFGEKVSDFLTFSSNLVSTGNLYAVCGFVQDGLVKPDYMYVGGYTNWIRQPKERFQKKRFKEDNRLLWDESWTESRCAKENQLYRIYDAGKIKWRKSFAE